MESYALERAHGKGPPPVIIFEFACFLPLSCRVPWSKVGILIARHFFNCEAIALYLAIFLLCLVHYLQELAKPMTPQQLIADLGEWVIGPAEAKVRELRGLTSGSGAAQAFP
jgi:hypothetical protein